MGFAVFGKSHWQDINILHMTEVKDIHVYDLEECVIASGYAMTTEPYDYAALRKNPAELKRAFDRCQRLVIASKTTDVHCHDNFLTGIRVSFDIKYPQYLTPEMQRYHFYDIVTSQSKMHRLSKMKLRTCTNAYTSPEVIRVAQEQIDNYQNIVNDTTIDHFEYWTCDGDTQRLVSVTGREESLYAAFMVMVNSCPLGLELWMRVSTNYKQLQTIYHQRIHHRLKEDWGAITNMIQNLPHFKEFIAPDPLPSPL